MATASASPLSNGMTANCAAAPPTSNEMRAARALTTAGLSAGPLIASPRGSRRRRAARTPATRSPLTRGTTRTRTGSPSPASQQDDAAESDVGEQPVDGAALGNRRTQYGEYPVIPLGRSIAAVAQLPSAARNGSGFGTAASAKADDDADAVVQPSPRRWTPRAPVLPRSADRPSSRQRAPRTCRPSVRRTREQQGDRCAPSNANARDARRRRVATHARHARRGQDPSGRSRRRSRSALARESIGATAAGAA